jgi:hypothetical protein
MTDCDRCNSLVCYDDRERFHLTAHDETASTIAHYDWTLCKGCWQEIVAFTKRIPEGECR